MGDIADMILEGILDELTGEYIGDRNKKIYGEEAPGFPVSYQRKATHKIACPICNKLVTPSGLQQHTKVKHMENQDA